MAQKVQESYKGWWITPLDESIAKANTWYADGKDGKLLTAWSLESLKAMIDEEERQREQA
jgi:hypothetical protein